jgi:hypothetical protein
MQQQQNNSQHRARWLHNRNKCHESLQLDNPITKVNYGFKAYNETHNVTNSYDSLAHMWKEWYKPYFLDDQYNQTPRLIVRHEDMVYRPEKVVQKICECVGGTNRNPNPDWEHPDGFEYEEESANTGKGHGRAGRSGLMTAFIKYGQPLRNWYDQYNAIDRTIMKQAFQGETDPELRKIFETLNYPLFDDVGEPTKADKQRSLQRYRAEEREKNARAKAIEMEKQQKCDDLCRRRNCSAIPQCNQLKPTKKEEGNHKQKLRKLRTIDVAKKRRPH